MHSKLNASQPLVPHIAVPESGVLLQTHRCIDKSHSCLTGASIMVRVFSQQVLILYWCTLFL